MRNLLLIFATLISISLFSQEICDNGIDDDGDGLIDLNDSTDCNCEGFFTTVPSMIPNPSFEDHTCCPDDFSELHCAVSWMQASDATSDYWNTCDAEGNDFAGYPPLPAPDGEGYVGFINMNDWQEYIGACLSEPMHVGNTYILNFWIGPSDMSPDFNLTFFGATSCNNLPFSGSDCPVGQGSWQELTSIPVHFDSQEWLNLTVTFTPNQDIYALVFGPPCGSISDYSYYYLDNLILNESSIFSSVSINATGHLCTNDMMLHAQSEVDGNWQWYYEGVAIVGETDSILDISGLGYGEGTYQARISTNEGCDIGKYEFSVLQPSVQITSSSDVLCNGGNDGWIDISVNNGTTPYTYFWTGPNNFTSTSEDLTDIYAGEYTIVVTDSNGCTATTSATVNQPDALSLGTTNVNESCLGNNDGSIDLTVTGGTPDYSFNWSNGASTEDITNLSAGDYYVTVTDNNNCADSISVTLTGNPNPTPNITGTLAICDGESTVLDAGSYESYIWNTNETTQTISVSTAGTYSVIVTDHNGCTGSDEVTVDVQSVSTSITGNLIICPGDSTTLDAGAGFAHYLWNTGATSQTITTSNEGNYSVIVSNDIGCAYEDQVNVNIDYINLQLSGNNLICYGDSANLVTTVTSGGVPPFNYFWNTGATSSSITVSPDTETTYSVYLTDAIGCISDTEQTTIKVTPPVYLNIYANADTVCPGDPVLITSTISGGIPPYTLTDRNNNIVNGDNFVYPYHQEIYTYTATDACGATDKDTVVLNTYTIPPLDIQADILSGCEPLTVNFTTSQNNNNYSYFWGFESGNIGEMASGANVEHTFDNYGVYDVSLSVTTDKGCKNSLRINDLINVYRRPEAHFLTNPKTASIINPQIQFSNLSKWASHYVWAFGDGDSSNYENPAHIYPEINEYTVSLIAITEHGCTDTARQVINIVEEPTLYVPTAFSPDGDGVNDLFVVKANGIDLDNYEIKIYDRWGELIFESNDLYKSWDGTAKGGTKKVETGTYIWLVTAKDINGTEFQKSGTVTVIR